MDYIGRFGEESGIELETVTFESGEQFLKNYKLIFDIIIFDIDMPAFTKTVCKNNACPTDAVEQAYIFFRK